MAQRVRQFRAGQRFSPLLSFVTGSQQRFAVQALGNSLGTPSNPPHLHHSNLLGTFPVKQETKRKVIYYGGLVLAGIALAVNIYVVLYITLVGLSFIQ